MIIYLLRFKVKGSKILVTGHYAVGGTSSERIVLVVWLTRSGCTCMCHLYRLKATYGILMCRLVSTHWLTSSKIYARLQDFRDSLRCLPDHVCSSFDAIQACDRHRQSDNQTQGHGVYRAVIKYDNGTG